MKILTKRKEYEYVNNTYSFAEASFCHKAKDYERLHLIICHLYRVWNELKTNGLIKDYNEKVKFVEIPSYNLQYYVDENNNVVGF